MNNRSVNETRYDVCLISISAVSSDARTLNIARTLAKHGKTVAIIAFGKEKDCDMLQSEHIDLYPVEDTGFSSANSRWRYFNKEIKKYNGVQAGIYQACDFFALAAANRFSRRYRVPFIYDSREIYSRVGSLSKSPLKQLVQTALEKRWVKKVSRIIVSGELDAEYLKKHFRMDVPYDVILNLPPYREAVSADLFRENYPIGTGQKIILYQGMLMKGRGILPVVEALPYLDNLVFCLLGTGDLTGAITARAKELGVEDRVYICGNVDYSELHRWTCSADIGNCFIEPIAFCNELALPNKMFEYCMAGIPSIISGLPAMKQFNDKYAIGKTIPADSRPEEIADAIREVLTPEVYAAYEGRCKEASKSLSYESQEQTILEIFNE